MIEIILDGGKPLLGCPKNFVDANKWADKANEGKDRLSNPKWSFDCGFKLDFDGPVVGINSRFYPPKEFYGNLWDGTITVMIMGKDVLEKKIEADSLDDLKNKAEKFLKEFVDKLTV